MQYFFQLFANASRRLLYAGMMSRLFQRINSELQHCSSRVAINRIKNSFRKCGSDVTIFLPITVVTPEFVEIGSNVSFAHYVHIWGGGGLKIGDNVMIGAHAAITTATHDHSVTDKPMCKTLIHKPITIGSDVWIGSNAVILPGLTIGNGAVVGAGSVVTRDVGPYEIVGGVPARVISKRQPSLWL